MNTSFQRSTPSPHVSAHLLPKDEDAEEEINFFDVERHLYTTYLNKSLQLNLADTSAHEQSTLVDTVTFQQSNNLEQTVGHRKLRI